MLPWIFPVSADLAWQIYYCGVHKNYLVTTASVTISLVLKAHLPQESQICTLIKTSVFTLVLACACHNFCWRKADNARLVLNQNRFSRWYLKVEMWEISFVGLVHDPGCSKYWGIKGGSLKIMNWKNTSAAQHPDKL